MNAFAYCNVACSSVFGGFIRFYLVLFLALCTLMTVFEMRL